VVLKNSININIYNINNNKMQFLRVSNASSHAATVVPECYKEYYQMFTRLVFYFWGVLPTRYRLGRCADFDDQYVIRRRFAQGCAFWESREQIFLQFDPIFAKNANVWSIFDGTSKISAQNGRALTWGTSSVNTDKTTSYAFGSWMLNREINPYKSKSVVNFYPGSRLTTDSAHARPI